MAGMSLSLHVAVSPDRWPGDAAQDVSIRVAMRNDGKQPEVVVPQMAKLAPIGSFAGVGVTWNVALADDVGKAVHVKELRKWYGPPGNPPAPGYVKQNAVTIKPGAEFVAELGGCWIPNVLLEPRHLDPATLDPEGMDNVVAPARFAGAVPLSEEIEMARASVLVLTARWAQLDKARSAADFLRGHVVAFVPHAGTYQLRVQYVQASWMDIGQRLRLDAGPLPVHID